MCLDQPNQSLRSKRHAQLILDIGSGSREAFELLHQDTSSATMMVIQRLEPNFARAEEIHQECYIKVWQSAASYDPCKGQPSSWLNAIARNAGLDHLRRARTRHDVSKRLAIDFDSDVDPLEVIATEEPGPLDRLSAASASKALCLCMDRLTSAQRQALALAYFHDLSHAEVASALRQPLGTVKSWVRRSLISLRACIEQPAGVFPGNPDGPRA